MSIYTLKNFLNEPILSNYLDIADPPALLAFMA